MILGGRIGHDELVRWVSGHLGADRGCGDDQSDDKESCWSHGIAPDEVDVSRFPFLVSRSWLTPPCSQTRPRPARSAAAPPPPRAPRPPPAETRAARCASRASPPPAPCQD